MLLTESEILDQIHDVIVTRDRYEEYAKRAMRDATEEELKSVNDYVESISEETGIDFYNEIQKS